MQYKATVSFSGAVSMYEGEVKELQNTVALTDLIRCGYIVPAEQEATDDAENAEHSDTRRRKTRCKD